MCSNSSQCPFVANGSAASSTLPVGHARILPVFGMRRNARTPAGSAYRARTAESLASHLCPVRGIVSIKWRGFLLSHLIYDNNIILYIYAQKWFFHITPIISKSIKFFWNISSLGNLMAHIIIIVTCAILYINLIECLLTLINYICFWFHIV